MSVNMLGSVCPYSPGNTVIMGPQEKEARLLGFALNPGNYVVYRDAAVFIAFPFP